MPSKVEDINDTEDEDIKSWKYTMNAIYRENGQRNLITKGLEKANDEEYIRSQYGKRNIRKC